MSIPLQPKTCHMVHNVLCSSPLSIWESGLGVTLEGIFGTSGFSETLLDQIPVDFRPELLMLSFINTRGGGGFDLVDFARVHERSTHQSYPVKTEHPMIIKDGEIIGVWLLKRYIMQLRVSFQKVLGERKTEKHRTKIEPDYDFMLHSII